MIQCPQCKQQNPERREHCGFCELDLVPFWSQPPSVRGPMWVASLGVVALVLAMWAAASQRVIEHWFHKAERAVTPPVVAGDTLVYGTSDDRLVALDAGSGAVRWEQAPAKLDSVRAPLLHCGGLIYYRDGSHGVRAARMEDGAQVFRRVTETPAGPLAVWRNLLLVPQAGCLMLLDRRTGVERARIPVARADTLAAPLVWGRHAFVGYARAAGKRLYAGINQQVAGGLYAFDLAEREVAWQVDLPWRVAKQPLRAGGRLLLLEHGGARGQMVAVDPNNGDLLWRARGEGSTMFFADGLAWRGGFDPEAGEGRFLALDPTTGEQRRAFAFELDVPRRARREAEAKISDAFVVGDRVLFGCYDQLFCYDATLGEPLWRWTTQGRVTTRPLHAHDLTVVVTDDGFVHGVEGP